MTTATKLPEITVEIDRMVTLGELKAIQEWIEETKPQLEEYTAKMMAQASADQAISWHRIFEIEATYFSSGEMPAIRISGMVFDRTSSPPGNMIFAEVFTLENESVASRYVREA